jgi:hypothetical protein
MVNKIDIEKQVEKTLNSLEGLQRAAAPPFIVTRIQQGIVNRQEQYRLYGKIWRLALVLTLLAILNGAYFLQIRARNQPETEIAAALVAEYALQYNVTDF